MQEGEIALTKYITDAENEKKAQLLVSRGNVEDKVKDFEYLYSSNDIKNKFFIDISKLAAHEEKEKLKPLKKV